MGLAAQDALQVFVRKAIRPATKIGHHDRKESLVLKGEKGRTYHVAGKFPGQVLLALVQADLMQGQIAHGNGQNP